MKASPITTRKGIGASSRSRVMRYLPDRESLLQTIVPPESHACGRFRLDGVTVRTSRTSTCHWTTHDRVANFTALPSGGGLLIRSRVVGRSHSIARVLELSAD